MTQYQLPGGNLDAFTAQLTAAGKQTQGRVLVPQMYLDCYEALRAQPLATPQLLAEVLKQERFQNLTSPDVMTVSLENYGLVKRLHNGTLLVDPITWLTKVE